MYKHRYQQFKKLQEMQTFKKKIKNKPFNKPISIYNITSLLFIVCIANILKPHKFENLEKHF